MLVKTYRVLDHRLEVNIGVILLYSRWELWWLWFSDFVDCTEVARLVRVAALMFIMWRYVTVPIVVVLKLIGYFNPLFVQLIFKFIPFTPRAFLFLDLPYLLYSKALIFCCGVFFALLELPLWAVMALQILATKERKTCLFSWWHHILILSGQVHRFQKGMFNIVCWVCIHELLHLHLTFCLIILVLDLIGC